MKENKKFKGRYQQIITPGKYLIEVTKPGYEVKIILLLGIPKGLWVNSRWKENKHWTIKGEIV